MRGVILFVCSLILLHGSSVFAQGDNVVIKIDPVTLITKSTEKYKGSFKLDEKQAVSQMDDMLVNQYAARGRIESEKDSYLKGLYYQATTLLLNGYPIAGGVIVSVARNSRQFGQSPVGPGLASFVDAMLQPTEDDPDLAEMQQEVEHARSILKDLRPDIRFYADLWVIGTIYRDDIAVDAGKSGADAMKITRHERGLVMKALNQVSKAK